MQIKKPLSLTAKQPYPLGWILENNLRLKQDKVYIVPSQPLVVSLVPVSRSVPRYVSHTSILFRPSFGALFSPSLELEEVKTCSKLKRKGIGELNGMERNTWNQLIWFFCPTPILNQLGSTGKSLTEKLERRQRCVMKSVLFTPL